MRSRDLTKTRTYVYFGMYGVVVSTYQTIIQQNKITLPAILFCVTEGTKKSMSSADHIIVFRQP